MWGQMAGYKTPASLLQRRAWLRVWHSLPPKLIQNVNKATASASFRLLVWLGLRVTPPPPLLTLRPPWRPAAGGGRRPVTWAGSGMQSLPLLPPLPPPAPSRAWRGARRGGRAHPPRRRSLAWNGCRRGNTNLVGHPARLCAAVHKLMRRPREAVGGHRFTQAHKQRAEAAHLQLLHLFTQCAPSKGNHTRPHPARWAQDPPTWRRCCQTRGCGRGRPTLG